MAILIGAIMTINGHTLKIAVTACINMAINGYLKNSRLFSKKLTSNFFGFSILKNSRLIRREVFKEKNLKNSRLFFLFFLTKGCSKLSHPVRWSLERKFGFTFQALTESDTHQNSKGRNTIVGCMHLT